MMNLRTLLTIEVPDGQTFSTVSHNHDASVPSALDVDRRLCQQYQELTHKDGVRWQRSFRILRLLGPGRAGNGIPRRKRRLRLLHPAGRDQVLLAGVVSGRRLLSRRHAKHRPQCPASRHDPSPTTCSTSTTSSSRTASASPQESGVGRRLQPARPPLHRRDADACGRDSICRRSEPTTSSASSWRPGPTHPRFQPGIAIQILRECLGGLGAACNREGYQCMATPNRRRS